MTQSHRISAVETPRARILPWLLAGLAIVAGVPPGRSPARAQTADVIVYADGLAAGWSDWSWCARDLAHHTTVHQGSSAAAVTFDDAWVGLYFHAATAVPASPYIRLDFWIHGGATGGQRLRVVVNGNTGQSYQLTPLPTTWTHVSIPLSALGSPASIQDVYWQDATGAQQPQFFLDDIVFVAGEGPPPPPPGAGPTLTVDVSADRAPISPLIYGMNFADEDLARELALPVNRWGGNATTRYNWQLDVSNRASDWYFENIPNDVAQPGLLPDNSSSDRFVEANRSIGAESILTMPLIGWTPKSRSITCGFSVAKYGAQQSTDPWRSDCGNGVRGNGQNVTANDPADTSVAIGPAFVTGWIAHLRGRYGAAAQGGVRFYQLDNEPELWNSTHRDVHPTPLGYDGLLQRSVEYARAIKDADPDALTLGPVGWGWTAYFYSAADAAAGGAWWDTRPDRRAHGDLPLVEWYLREMRAQGEREGRRLLDYFDLHYYPQAPGVTLQGAGDASTQALRLRSTRSLWDPAYSDESWIAGTEGGPAVRLIPRMRDWVATHYPGTRLAITEYNWGGLEHISGAVAQADVLGVFGREALDLATLWAPPEPQQPGAFAFRVYRNYDGAGGRFGDTRVRAASTDQDIVAIYAAERTADRALTVVVVNKTTTAQTSTLQVAGASPSAPARVFRYSEADLTRIVRLSDTALSATQALTFPARSITVLEVPLATTPPRTVTLSGTVTSGVSPLPGVTITLSGGCGATAATTSAGTYSLTVPPAASCIVTPSLSGRTFVPVSRAVALDTDLEGVDFEAVIPGTVAVSGFVHDPNGAGLGGVTVSAGGRVTTTDDGGAYTLVNLTSGGTYVVTASKSGFTFAPASQAFAGLQANATAAPFVAQSGLYTRYFAEGATGPFFDVSLALLNATHLPAAVTIRFRKPDGSSVERRLQMAGPSRATVDPEAEPGMEDTAFATVIESTQPLVIDRTMTWGADRYGSHSETSLARPGTRWYFAEGATHSAFNLFYLLLNPDPVRTAEVTVRYLLPAPAVPLLRTYVVAPGARTNIWVDTEDAALENTDVSAEVTSTNGVPIIAERAMYADRVTGGRIVQFDSGHESAAVSSAATDWFLAEGATGAWFDMFVLIANPSGESAEVAATYLLPAGAPVTRTYVVPPGSRRSVWVDHEDPRLASTAVSASLRSANGVPIVVERAMWWPGDGSTWYEGHNSAGAMDTGEKWAVAGCEDGGPDRAEAYVLLANTSTSDATVRVALVFEDGSTSERVYALPPNSRTSLAVGAEFAEARGRRFGAVVESLGASPARLVVERAQYASPGPSMWTAGSNALGTRLR